MKLAPLCRNFNIHQSTKGEPPLADCNIWAYKVQYLAELLFYIHDFTRWKTPLELANLNLEWLFGGDFVLAYRMPFKIDNSLFMS